MKQQLQIFLDRHNNRLEYTKQMVEYWKNIDQIKKELNIWIKSREFNVAELTTEDIQELAILQDYYRPVTDRYFISALFYKPKSNTEES